MASIIQSNLSLPHEKGYRRDLTLGKRHAVKIRGLRGLVICFVLQVSGIRWSEGISTDIFIVGVQGSEDLHSTDWSVRTRLGNDPIRPSPGCL